ncbi:MAG: DUF3054 domain-containing protein [Actinomycetia bacterium]|nr:DUF3054 domain-containing protein [Actinomycetes bacterium]
MLRTPWTIAVDGLVAVVFALLGHLIHGGSLAPQAIAVTAWPFLVAALLGSTLARAFLRQSWVRSGVVVWLSTLVVGMLLRVTVSGSTARLPFVIAAAVGLALFFLGWRFAVARLGRRPQAAS